ncbi:MAG TPA: 16S rRNA (uracil(1498)-N(3))-methyltransferase [Methylophilaceae bacterium]|nr:16S rRNA (uracil(1498)-N(3))-methyltransferase [Methylophilaceae bacterium]
MPRFYCDLKHDLKHRGNLALGAVITLPERAATHASRALRLETGDGVILFNGDGNDYISELLLVKKNIVTAKVKSIKKVECESPIKVTLAQAISSGDRMDFTIQKAVEMGVTAIQPIASQRSVVKLSGERAEKRREHWQNIVISACEQSGRALVPEVTAPLTLANWLGTEPAFRTRIMLSPTATQTLQDLANPTGAICLLIGPEGGLTADEIDLAATHHFIPVRLGSRILRTETAALAALAAMQTLWGDFKA